MLQDFLCYNVYVVSVLKSIEFSSSGGDEVDGDIGKSKSLEMLLLEKNKSLQSENTQLKLSTSDLSGRLPSSCHVTSGLYLVSEITMVM